ncbi:restriction endonuclease subunit S [Campylobacter upsaliensis]|uniref:restriction endonuclease subunit S n=1 Tax=Campylobacter upsaliensis TaxID=28080 RepID=UPI0012868662|nr:restriction endonuclease subunit S [Campylobacter upsaliensis]EAJ2424407.1 methyltransferase [Campylobacter upsaliensis]EAJ4645548.1 methyltransferase [Campylobacter upsaliensis]EAJ7826868.1 methyltransferase [Campylobacter upsaliensis]EAK0297624.1 methyltransferase [Campylobacter upsaliensis]EAK1170107.1 methyltransferase [Campylobacter upsaliensis]
MNLDVERWVSFQVKDVLSIQNGKGITTEEIEENAGDFAVVQSGEENNGVLGKIDLNYCKLKGYIYTEKPYLTVARSGSAGFVSFQKDGCVVGDSAKILLLPDEVAKTEIYLFLHSILTANRFKYDYGRKVTENKYMSDYIDLPAITKGHKKKPDFEFMENYIKSLHYKPLTTKNRPENALPLNIEKWGEFSLNSLFEVVLSKGDIKIDEVESGLIPLVSSGETNNGVVGYIDSRGDGKAEIFKGNTITIDMFCNAFYQKDDFYAVSHGRVNILKPKFILNQYIAIFIITLIHQNKYRYSYGRALYSDEAKKMTIKLPINHKGELDFDFMENYIKSLPYGDRV